MRDGFFDVAKDFILHRASIGEQSQPSMFDIAVEEKEIRQFKVGDSGLISETQLSNRLKHACSGLDDLVSAEELLENSITNFYEGMKDSEVDQATIMADRVKIEIEPAYAKVAARLLSTCSIAKQWELQRPSLIRVDASTIF